MLKKLMQPTPLKLTLTENFVYFIFTAVLQMKTSPKGDFVRFSSLLGTNLSPKYG